MANHHLTAMPMQPLLPVMPVQIVPDGDRGTGIHSPRAGHWIPAFAGITAGGRLDPCAAARFKEPGRWDDCDQRLTTAPVMPVQRVLDGDRGTGIHSPRAGHWIPAFAGMTTGERVDRCDAARRKAARLAADAEDMAALEQAEQALEGKGWGKKK